MSKHRPRNGRKCLVLDLDETLVHTQVLPTHDCDFYVFGDYGVIVRPHVDAFLRRCVEHSHVFDVGVWTAGVADYAAAIVSRLFTPVGLAPAFVFSRERCTPVLSSHGDGYYVDVKDLRKVRRLGYALDGVLMIDNTPGCLRRNYGNCVPIPSFTGNPLDDYLERVWPYLLEWFAAPSVRPIEKRAWHLARPMRRSWEPL